MAEIRYLLDETIEMELQNLKNFNGDGKVALYKLHIDEVKTEVDAEEKRERRVMERARQENERANQGLEEAFKRRQLKEQAINRYVKVGIAAAELIAPLIFYAVWMKRGFKFEETGTFGSTTFRNLFNRFKPTAKG